MKVKRVSKLRRVFSATRRQMNRAVSFGMETGEEEMQNRVPVDDGDLRSTCRKRDDGIGHGLLMAGGPSEISDEFVDYERHVEYGTVNQTAQPFFRPAVDSAVRSIKQNLKIVEK